MKSLSNQRIGHFSSALYMIIILAIILVAIPQSSEAGIVKVLKKVGEVVTYPVWKPVDIIFVKGVYKGILRPCYEKGQEMERLSAQREPETLTGVKVSFSTDGKGNRSYQKTHAKYLAFCLLVENKKSYHVIKKPMFRRAGSSKWHKTYIGLKKFGMNYRLKSKMTVPNGQYGSYEFEGRVEVWDINSNTFIEYRTCTFTYKYLRPGQRW